MIDREEYLKNPCDTLAIPYWKNKKYRVPSIVKILHDKQFSESLLETYNDVPYFRMYHELEHVESNTHKDFYIRMAKEKDIDKIVQIINASYIDICVTREQMKGYTQTEVYEKKLWILVCEYESGTIVGCGIADLDKEMQEGILEWIQVLPEHRSRGVGKLIVNDLLQRMKGHAKFVTVSGQVNNKTNPERLYRNCGFKGNDIWHILSEK